MKQLKIENPSDPTLEYEIEVTEEGLQMALNHLRSAKGRMLTGQSAKIKIGALAGADVVFIYRPEIGLYGGEMEKRRVIPPAVGFPQPAAYGDNQ